MSESAPLPSARRCRRRPPRSERRAPAFTSTPTIRQGAILAGLLAALTLVLPAAASAATALPELLAPTSAELTTSPVLVTYKLPEAAAPGSLKLTFVEGSNQTVVTLAAAELSAGEHSFELNVHSLPSDPHVAAASASSLADGTYTVVLSYQNVSLEPAASAAATKVVLQTSTAAPTLTAPADKSLFRETFEVEYTLPEAALAHSVTLRFAGERVGLKTIKLESTQAGTHKIAIDPLEPAAEPGVEGGAEVLPPDLYMLTVSYRDALGNPEASSSAVAVRISAALCKPGTYSESGEAPCTEAPAGDYAEGTGATMPTLCEAGTFNPNRAATTNAACMADQPGHYSAAGAGAQQACSAGRFAPETHMSACIPAGTGHFVPNVGETAEMACEPGTFSGLSGASVCPQAPKGFYAPAPGTVVPTPCPAGTNDPHTGSSSQAACELDAPGTYSGQGSANAVACEPGAFAASHGSVSCTPAAAGSYVELAEASAAKLCPAGSYASQPGSVKCTQTPANTYAAGGASAPIPCPAGTEAPAGSSSCTAIPVGPVQPATPPQPSAPGTAPPPTSVPLVPQAPSFAFAPPRRQVSLLRAHAQRYALSCSAAVAVSARVTATIALGRRRLKLQAAAREIACVAGARMSEQARFVLTSAARRLLLHHAARVSLSIVLYPAARAPTSSPLAAARGVPGRR